MANVYKTKYTTVQGETWDQISEAFYETPLKVHEIISVNPEYADVLTFDDGIELKIPILESESPDTLPPWKRG
jgi:nucleoid-associated protein YgaU